MSGPSEIDRAYYPKTDDQACQHERGWVITNGYRCADCGRPKPKTAGSK